MRALILMAASLLLAGCPLEQGAASGPVKVCKEAAQQCVMQAGQLGVCTPDAGGKLTCFSQH